ncbi:hypothetical protein HCN44_010080 [Aphidius gifuensis]|uniref:Uncharacterized protein n=1 Tax=Aphidius gifuensis TaxID=684658 RepID=A0A835CUM0_APHGI|nr:uncharacterized protein LOC122851669 [Aphidius gifuensis]KAF7993485.1 hypothetical protein HCN44_010080 [Aphidius gifuensis]
MQNYHQKMNSRRRTSRDTSASYRMMIFPCRTMDLWTFEFFYTIFQWETDWFDNPKNHLTSEKSLREILGDNCPLDLNSTLLCYNSTKDYYETMKPLMMHEFFHGLLKDTDDEDDPGDSKNSNRAKSIIGSIESIQETSGDCSSTKKLLVIRMKISYDYDKWRDPTKPPPDTPQRGDLVHVIYNGRRKVFGYIDDMDWKHQDCTLTTRQINTNHLNRNLKLKTVKSIQQDLRKLRALQELPESSLFNAIMKPNELDYTIRKAGIESISRLKLKQKKLN